MEELVLKKIRGGLRGIRMGTKTVEEANIMHYLMKLEKLNDGLYEDYMKMYIDIQKNMS